MSLVTIRGTADQIRRLDDVPELMIDRESAHNEGAVWRVSAHASDAAVSEVQSRGVTVDVLMTTAALNQHLSVVEAQIDRGAGNDRESDR